MKKFIAKIIKDGTTQTHTINAINLENAKDILSKNGTIIEIKEIKEYGLNLSFKAIDERILAIYIKELSALLEAGVSVLDAFNSVAKGCDNPKLKQIFNDISADLNAGASLEKALNTHKDELGSVVLAMFALGQNSGKLASSLSTLSNMLENISINRAKFKKAIRYPALTFVALLIAFNILITMVMPSFKGIFDSFGGELYWASRAILALGSFVSDYGILIAFGSVFVIFLIWYFHKFNYKFQLKFDEIMLKIPLLKRLILYSFLAKFNLILSQLITAGTPIDKALVISNSVVDNSYIKLKINQAIKDIYNGNTLNSSFQKIAIYENIAIEIIKVGEKSGTIDQMFGYISNYYKEKYDSLIDNLSAYLEPILLVIISVAVLVLALGIFMPLWDISNRANLY
ncbi:transformation system, type II secretion system membrane protein CtsF [Campylobacter lanienae NCTC 13004]|uniref:Transformation system, type II secretion system membrane protein CtsF n=1 Tax=Campylobacter lanienae NCTC 13004 TaxID=1031753 RepID=A0A1X9SPX0_9BACT|nr:type II secretion system F family protein [Campylobacter lanienae]ARQ98297.1 transformation system, type II secretion system membrane protein CtsF [Campylobacter lanienae NCTC 13004]